MLRKVANFTAKRYTVWFQHTAISSEVVWGCLGGSNRIVVEGVASLSVLGLGVGLGWVVDSESIEEQGKWSAYMFRTPMKQKVTHFYYLLILR